MKLIVKLLIICFCIPSIYGNASTSLSLLLQNIKSYEASYQQITRDDKGRILQKSKGRMLLKKPGQFRWETNKPTQQIIMTNGKLLWIYDVDLAQVTREILTKQTKINPAILLSGSLNDLNQNFDIQLLQNKNQLSFILKPRNSNDAFKQIKLLFKNKLLTQMSIINNLEQNSIFTFSNIKTNLTLSPHLFYFTPIAGVDIINQ